ncbi:hypothetical protein [Methylocapsa sp. S129]|uniref:hypothetical protein n=1 Tax=Methylocapsa sp. S129 TaxID=1641869 RepID=UPI00131B54AD|nr:hypothetical protein [Methylocapsa sp. S129]
MPVFTIETTYRLPIYRQRTYEAVTAEQACGLAIADEGWDDGKSDADVAGDTYVSGAWEGRDTAYSRKVLPIPSRFGEQPQRKAEHFEVLLGLLKIFANAPAGGLSDAADRRWRTDAAIAKAETILAGEGDPDVSPNREI